MEIDVTIYCITYNHVDYIRDALEGFLMQKTTYTYKVFVYDDASTDGTSDILLEYERKYPDIFDICIARENTYHSQERDSILQHLCDEHVEGKYVALCEGDDCWIDSNKLQLQIDYLEAHPECSMVAHASEWLDCNNNEKKEYHPYNNDRYLDAEEVIMKPGGNLSTASLVMRHEVFAKGNDFPKCDVGDVPLQLNALYKGNIYYFDKVMSLYRYSHKGSWTEKYDGNRMAGWGHKLYMVNFYRLFDRYSQYKFHSLLQAKARFLLYEPIVYYEQVTDQELKRITNMVNENTKERFSKWIRMQEEVIRLRLESDYINTSVLDYVKGRRFVVLMGTGKFSCAMTRKLANANIHVDGYVVSDNQTVMQESNDIPVWKISEYPYMWKETALIIAVGHPLQSEIEESLKEKGLVNYIAPYWLDIEKIWG